MAPIPSLKMLFIYTSTTDLKETTPHFYYKKLFFSL